jgi:hypothetical protein
MSTEVVHPGGTSAGSPTLVAIRGNSGSGKTTSLIPSERPRPRLIGRASGCGASRGRTTSHGAYDCRY